jgi:ATP-binding cassette subfamily B protein
MAQENGQNSRNNRSDLNIPIGPGGMPGGPGRGPGFGGRSRFMPVVKPRDFKGTLARLWKYFGKERKLFSVITVFVAAHSGIALAVPYFIKYSIDAISPKDRGVDFGLLGMAASALAAMYIK